MRLVLLAALSVAVPNLVWAQPRGASDPASHTGAREQNLANPQAQQNEALQPSNAQTAPNSGDAAAIPTPTLGGRQMTPVNPAPR